MMVTAHETAAPWLEPELVAACARVTERLTRMSLWAGGAVPLCCGRQMPSLAQFLRRHSHLSLLTAQWSQYTPCLMLHLA